MGFEKSEWVWMNGEIKRWADATVHVSAHALHYGSGVFEGMRCYETANGPAVFQMGPHLHRLYASAAVYGIDVPYGSAELEEAIRAVIVRNGFADCYVRPICFYGSSSLSVNPRTCPVETAIFAWPWGAYLGAEGVERGVRVTVSPWMKFHSSMMPTTAKACGQYLNSMLAVRDAHSRGFDEAILLDADGNIAEGSGENLFVLRGGRLLTNDEDSSILLGVTRGVVIKLAQDLGYPVDVTTLRLEDLRGADEAFFTGTAVEVTPIREIDGEPIGSGCRGPVTERLQQAFWAAASGRDLRYRAWLDPVAERPAAVGS